MRSRRSGSLLTLGSETLILAAESPTGGDPFDIAPATTVTSDSGETSSILEALFVAPAGGPEPGRVFFSDAPAGTVHFVEWRTLAPVLLEGFNLHAAGDLPNIPQRRAFNHFRLQAKVNDVFETLYDEDVAVPYVFVDGQIALVISAAVTPTTAQEFRAEFTQHLERVFFGPRVMELDGFPAEPCADANYNDFISASDALGALRASVGITGCPLCVCDVDSGGTITATDALAILRNSVGLSTALTCTACFVSSTLTTTTLAGPTTTTNASRSWRT
jgi:hypothetical protein